MKNLLVLLLLLMAVYPAQAQGHSRGSGRKDVHVGGYYRKDGTYVHSHDRARTAICAFPYRGLLDHGTESLQFCEFGPGLFYQRHIGIGICPDGKQNFVRRFRLRRVSHLDVCARELQARDGVEGIDHE